MTAPAEAMKVLAKMITTSDLAATIPTNARARRLHDLETAIPRLEIQSGPALLGDKESAH
jgi:hypothetical protein